MAPEARKCQNCAKEFHIDTDDFAFYRRLQVPSPTWCPECRMIRRFLFRNEHQLFRRKNDRTGKELFSGFPQSTPVKVYDHDYWLSDGWDPMSYGREYDFSRPFFEQFRELLYAVPFPSRDIHNMVNSDYSNQADSLRNAYLCFDCTELENCAYIISAVHSKESFDLFETRHSELCYEGYMIDESYRVFFSVNCEECTDIWFSKNLMGCSNCFGCMNLRNKSYHIFNKPYSKEEYKKQLAQFDIGSYRVKEDLVKQAREFWKKHPERFTIAIRVVNSTGEHIEKSKNLKYCYSIHGGEDLAYCQFITGPATDSYDYTIWGAGASRIYESITCGLECDGLRFCWNCWPSSKNLEYSAYCRSSSDLFGCAGLKKKQYCILNKQYSQDDYLALREKIVQNMNNAPYTDKRGRVYRYGEFFPPEFSPFAYNETFAFDFFPLSREAAENAGYTWRVPEVRHYDTTVNASELPDHIKDIDDSILKEIIKCASCGRAYRIIQMELEFYKNVGVPLPRLCHDCRFQERFKFINPPKFWAAKCQCAGGASDPPAIRRAGQQPATGFQYQNTAVHPSHNSEEHCPNEFETSYAPGRPEIVYCEHCYKSEVA
ncbi:MAG: hypothetical protein A3C07_01300 [Candidatus Sungbacteria bacterium RIFCSPHIGHO2_02_FULL_47_11]|uniref:Uncharacterized protein n=1 Tax=Candidatus Sungbacteria bacterium RIFCSPHIGHO2_02_FULL_47_11 TaxID=1802270 RepID=A0A1G2KIE2_9BACT|nr:MAG: hypothetical protein A3C07_01300 [Candidatus Sungbacteria bacterium RIFCSPHIGHO2_02_FULL_47_11]